MLNSTSYQLFGNQNISEPLAMTIGNFDGVHAGHCYLINELKNLNPRLPVAVVTFDPHPETFFHPQNPKPLLTSLDEKVRILLEFGVDVVIVQKFSKEFSSLSADDFCFWLKKNFNIHTLMLGHDFHYGKGRKGNFEHMQNFAKHENWVLKQAPAYKISTDKIVSSSFIREVLARGELDIVEKLLTRPYFLSGSVVRGDGRGSKLGFHTANICLNENLVIPKYGVYACYVEILSCPAGHDRHTLLPAVMNCGVRPTIPGESKLQIEAHILNFSADIYDKKVKFHLKKFIREEKKFNGLEQLKEQIAQDILITKNYFLSMTDE